MTTHGIIMKGIGGFYYVDADETLYECKARGIFRKRKQTPLVGDRVVISVPENGYAMIEEIEERLGDLHQRGVAMHGDMTLRDLYDERTSLYEKYADVVCEADGMVLRDVVMSIKEKIGDFL